MDGSLNDPAPEGSVTGTMTNVRIASSFGGIVRGKLRRVGGESMVWTLTSAKGEYYMPPKATLTRQWLDEPGFLD